MENNIISHNVDSRKAFDELIPLIEHKMSEVQQIGTEDDNSMQDKKEKPVRLKDIIYEEPDTVKIFAIGSCNPETRIEKYHALLEYKGQNKCIMNVWKIPQQTGVLF